MILRQFLHREPVIAASYLFGCGGESTCVVVDPVEDVGPYLEAAEAVGMVIDYVIDTHAHADHISGGRKLAEKTGAQYVLHASAKAGYDYLAARDEDIIKVGNVTVQVLHTPGHTPEHISLLVTDTRRGTAPGLCAPDIRSWWATWDARSSQPAWRTGPARCSRAPRD